MFKNAISAKFCNGKSSSGEKKVGAIEMGFPLAYLFNYLLLYI